MGFEVLDCLSDTIVYTGTESACQSWIAGRLGYIVQKVNVKQVEKSEKIGELFV